MVPAATVASCSNEIDWRAVLEDAKYDPNFPVVEPYVVPLVAPVTMKCRTDIAAPLTEAMAYSPPEMRTLMILPVSM